VRLKGESVSGAPDPRHSTPAAACAAERRPAREARVPAIAQRTALVNRLRAAHGCSLVALVAPAGYGKTTLISQWAEREERSFAWIAPNPTSRALAPSVACVLRELAGDEGIPDLPTPERLAASWARAGKASVLVFDDAHLLGDEAAALVSRLVAATPTGSLVVLAGRALPRLADPSLPLLRATGRLLELGAGDLAMSRREAGAALKALGVSVAEAELTALLEETEGWATGIQAAAAADSGATADFFRQECLDALAPETRSFLRRTSLLETLCGPLCDAMMGTSGSGGLLESLAAMNVFLVSLDRRGEWYRYHHLLRDSLRQELTEHEPELVAELHQRAAAWLEQHGDSGAALSHAHAGGIRKDFMRIFGAAALSQYNRGRSREVYAWLDDLGDDDLLAADPQAAVVAARLHAHAGRPDEAKRWLAAASARGGDDPATDAAVTLVRAAMCTRGARAMLADAEHALEAMPGDHGWRSYGLLLQGTACALLGEHERSGAILGRAVRAAERLEAHDTRLLALAERSLLAAASGSRVEADDCALRARATGEEHGLEGHPGFALALALCARMHLRNGDWRAAQTAFGRAQRLLPELTCALPWLSIQARLELVAAFVMLRDGPSATALLAEADLILSARPRVGRLRRDRDRAAADIAAIPAALGGQTVRLSRAELRLLPLLGTHLSFREIGAHLFLSRHTVKTQAISAYRKLGASSRREAVVEAARLALIEPPTDLGAFSS
jgi:LuxR family transcriptional regulator, maltose regulon positive regulatory protein